MTGMVMLTKGGGCGVGKITRKATTEAEEQQNQLSLVTLLLDALKKSVFSSCKLVSQDGGEAEFDSSSFVHQMEIGWPTNVQHLTHVTFDRFHGFLGLPLEFQVEIPCKAPSASVSVFGVSAESMQCSYDLRGNSVPTILLLMQERLYSQGGLKSEGIFRINPENSKEEHVREQLNRGIVPQDIDVHCLAGLIKAWFRELPSGILDGLSPEEVLQCTTEEDSIELVKQLKPTETALLNWAVDLMADVVEHEDINKMNARNIAMVFAPNMTQMSDPLTALMHAVQVMNLLKTLIMRTVQERDEALTGDLLTNYSPTSNYSSDRLTDYENTSCELRASPSIHTEQIDYNTDSEIEEEIQSICETEKCFSEQVDDDIENTKNSCELGGSPSSHTEQVHYNTDSENKDDIESTCETEKCFLEQVDGDKENTRPSCELRGSPSSHTETLDYNTYGENGDESALLCESEKCSLKRIDDDEENTRNSCCEELGDLQEEQVLGLSAVDINESKVDHKTSELGEMQEEQETSPRSSHLSTSGGVVSGLSVVDNKESRVYQSTSELGEFTTDVNKVDKLVDSSFPLPFFGSFKFLNKLMKKTKKAQKNSYEFEGSPSGHTEQVDYNTDSENEDGIESICETDKCFLEQVNDDKENTRNSYELGGSPSSHTEPLDYNTDNGDESELLCESKMCFFKQVDDDKENTRNSSCEEFGDLQEMQETSPRSSRFSTGGGEVLGLSVVDINSRI